MADTTFSQPKADVWDVIVVGSGPAGLTAAIYTSRGAASTLILGGESWGGQLMLTTTVENYPGLPSIQGPEFMNQMLDHATSFGGKFMPKSVQSIDITSNPFKVSTVEEEYFAKTLIIATGAETKWLDAPGIAGFIGRGVSSCAPCDAPFFKDKKVAVVGGGDSAMEEALVLTKYASEVTIIHRRDTFKASAVMQDKVLGNPKVKVLWNTEVQKVEGTQKLETATLLDTKDMSTSTISLDGLFIAIGHTPSTSLFSGILELDERGYIKKKNDLEGKYQMATNIPGVFVAGDVHDSHYRQAVTAAGFGCMAGLEVLKYLEDKK